MGTSASRSGQSAQRGNQWTTAKREVTSFSKGSGSNVRSVVNNFVSAIKSQGIKSDANAGNGGGGSSRKSTSSFLTAISAGQSLGSFLSGVGTKGLDETLRKEGLGELIGKHPDQVLSAIADKLCSNNGTLDDALARSAMVEVLAEIFNDEEETYEDLRNRWDEQIDESALQNLMSLFLSQSIYQRFLLELGDRIESNAISVYQAEKKEKEILDFIKAMVKFDIANIDIKTFDWKSSEGQTIIEQNLATALSLL